MVARGRMHGAACLSDGAIERVDGSGSSEYGWKSWWASLPGGISEKYVLWGLGIISHSQWLSVFALLCSIAIHGGKKSDKASVLYLVGFAGVHGVPKRRERHVIRTVAFDESRVVGWISFSNADKWWTTGLRLWDSGQPRELIVPALMVIEHIALSGWICFWKMLV